MWLRLEDDKYFRDGEQHGRGPKSAARQCAQVQRAAPHNEKQSPI